MITSQSIEWNPSEINLWQSTEGWSRTLLSCGVFTLLATLPTTHAHSAETPLPVVSVSASADDGNVAANTLDGSMSTRWSASGDGQWIQYDLGANRTVGSVAIAWYNGNLRSTRFDIQTSRDRTVWTPVFSGSSSGTSASFETYDVVDSTARYVTIVCHGNNLNLWNSITELDLFAPTNLTSIKYKLLSGPTLALQFNSETGAVYQVQASSDFVNWVNVSPPITSTTVTQTWVDNVARPPAARIYRVNKLSYPKPTLTVAASDANAAEGGSNPGAFTLSRSGSTASSLTARYSLGGTAANGVDFTALSGSVTFASGSSVAIVTVSPIDDTAVEGNETVVLTLSNDSTYFVGSPGSATVTIADNDQATTQPTVTVTASDASASEGGPNSGTFTFNRSGSTATALALRYSIGGTAANGVDYGTLSGSLTIPSGSSSATLTVNPIDDTAVEANETVVLTLSADSAYIVGSPSSATVTIADNDQATTQPTVTVTASDASASESGPNSGTFTFSRTGSTAAALALRYSVGGTAANGVDYGTLSGSLTIPSGSSSATLTVNPTDDSSVEGSETVVVTLSADSAYVVGSPSSATVTIADNDSTGTTLPSSILNLTNWKLTLPVDTSHAGSPDEIRQPELAGFQDPNYFYVNSARDGVVFTAHCGGATTSGSGYPRSELREMTGGGSANASWSTTSGTHTMEIRQAVTHLPVAKPHVVTGQIHDASDDVIVFRLEGSKLFVDENGSGGPVLTSNYQLGTIFTVKFVARNGGVEAYYNGQYIYTHPVSSSGCYFKAGCYTQSNTSKGDSATAYGQVVIYNVTVTHQ